MLTLPPSRFDLLGGDLLDSDLFQRLEQELEECRAPPQRVPSAEMHGGIQAYAIALELPGVNKVSIDVKATGRTLTISAKRCQTITAPKPQSLPNVQSQIED